MRMWSDIQPPTGEELAWPHLVEEYEWADHLSFAHRQGTAHLEAADIMSPRQKHKFYAIGGHRAGGVSSGLPAHRVSWPSVEGSALVSIGSTDGWAFANAAILVEVV
jgi:hypothetical protein